MSVVSNFDFDTGLLEAREHRAVPLPFRIGVVLKHPSLVSCDDIVPEVGATFTQVPKFLVRFNSAQFLVVREDLGHNPHALFASANYSS